MPSANKSIIVHETALKMSSSNSRWFCSGFNVLKTSRRTLGLRAVSKMNDWTLVQMVLIVKLSTKSDNCLCVLTDEIEIRFNGCRKVRNEFRDYKSSLLPWRFKLNIPSAAYMRRWIGSALVQVMACRLFGAKPLSKPMQGYCQLDPWRQTSVKF